MELKKRVEDLEFLTKRNSSKLSSLLIVMLTMNQALRHKDSKEAQIPFIISLAALCVDCTIDIVIAIKKIRGSHRGE